MALLLGFGCGGGDGASPTADADPGGLGDAGVEPQFGAAPSFVHVRETSDGDGNVIYVRVTAGFRDSDLLVYDEVARAGSCRLLKSELGFCEPPCDGFCAAGGECRPFVPGQSAGQLTFAGLTEPLTLGSAGSAQYEWTANRAITSPGATIDVTAAGDRFGGFALSARATSPLDLDGPTVWDLSAGADFEVGWTPAHDGSRIRIVLNSDTAGHGQFHPAVLECDAPDTGSLAIPRSLVDPFVDPANWGCGDCASSSFLRYHRAITEVDGVEVEFVVGSELSLYAIAVR